MISQVERRNRGARGPLTGGSRGDCRDRQSPRLGPPVLFLTPLRDLWCGHFGLTIRIAATVAGLSTLATGFSGQLRVLRKAAFLVWNALAAHAGDLPLTLLIH